MIYALAHRPISKPPQNPLQEVLGKAKKELQSSIAFQEKATIRILQLAEYLESTSLNNMAKVQARAIIETCGFQDLAGQKLRSVMTNIDSVSEHLAALDAAAVATLPKVEPESKGLDQDEINRLLAGEDVKKVKGLS